MKTDLPFNLDIKVRCQLGDRPLNDNSYFEQLTKVVFRSGMNWQVIENKWPDFNKAFKKFSVKKVAKFNDTDIDRLMLDEKIVRNHRKILATIQNARIFLSLQKDYRNFSSYLDELRPEGEEVLMKALAKQFVFLGEATSLFFLRAVGEEMPKTLKRVKR